MKKTLELNEIKDKKLRRLLRKFEEINNDLFWYQDQGPECLLEKEIKEEKRKIQNQLINYLNNKNDKFNRIKK